MARWIDKKKNRVQLISVCLRVLYLFMFFMCFLTKKWQQLSDNCRKKVVESIKCYTKLFLLFCPVLHEWHKAERDLCRAYHSTTSCFSVFFQHHLSQMLATACRQSTRLTNAGGAGDAGDVTFQGCRTFLQILHEVEGMFICNPPTFTLNVWCKHVATLLKENDTQYVDSDPRLQHTLNVNMYVVCIDNMC